METNLARKKTGASNGAGKVIYYAPRTRVFLIDLYLSAFSISRSPIVRLMPDMYKRNEIASNLRAEPREPKGRARHERAALRAPERVIKLVAIMKRIIPPCETPLRNNTPG